MDFSYSEEQILFKRTVREFCEKKIASKAKEIDEKGEIPEEVIKDLARMGLLGITYSTDYGGSGADFTT
ncbi:MAG: acyl-CoA dehydrogenase family protein, partial [Methanosarcinales archaeon]